MTKTKKKLLDAVLKDADDIRERMSKRTQKRRKPKTHHLKCVPEPFRAIRSGIKRFEFRKNDRDFQVGDVLILEEWRPLPKSDPNGRYAGRSLPVTVTYMLSGPDFGIPEGYCIMSIEDGYKVMSSFE